MDSKKICFIMCVNNWEYANEAIYFINQLHVPDGYVIDVLTVEEAQSMAGGYNEAMRASDAKYKVYLHQDVMIVCRDFIFHMLDCFKNENIGMLGVVGAPVLAASKVMWHGERVGWIYTGNSDHMEDWKLGEVCGLFQKVEAIDGLLMATQVDIPWRDDIFDKWDFYDISQSFEFARAGYDVVVPHMEQPWCLHDDGFMNLKDYYGERDKFIEEYCKDELCTDREYTLLMQELAASPEDYRLYLRLGDWYTEKNPNQAYLCYENAAYFCEKSGNAQELKFTERVKDDLKNRANVTVKPCAVTVLSCGDGEKERACQKSLLVYCGRDACVFAGTEQIPVMNEEYSDYDILLLAGNSLMLPNTLFTMRMSLYADEGIGTVGCMSNQATEEQRLDISGGFRECAEFALSHNQYREDALEYKIWMDSFALLIKRSVISRVGDFDTGYERCTNIVNDYYTRVLDTGYRNVLCHNSLIFRWDESSDYTYKSELHDRGRFRQKWNFAPYYYTGIRDDLLPYMKEPSDARIRVLEVGCGMGATLRRIKYMYPNSEIYGIEIVERIAGIGAHSINIICGDIETMELPYAKHSLDYVIFGDVLEHLRNPEAVLVRMREYLKEDGKIITSIPNLMNAEVIYHLLRGDFTYEDFGIRDRTHLRFFTYKEILKMFERTGYRVDEVRMSRMEDHVTESFGDFFDKLLAIDGVAPKEWFDAFQYLVCATVAGR